MERERDRAESDRKHGEGAIGVLGLNLVAAAEGGRKLFSAAHGATEGSARATFFNQNHLKSR